MLSFIDVIEYETRQRPWKSTRFYKPEWFTVKSYIEKLDQIFFPSVWLCYGNEIPDDPHIIITGGNHIFVIEGLDKNGHYSRYCNLHYSNKEVDVWKSDQGFSTEEIYVSYELNDVLAIAKYFYQSGNFNSQFIWEGINI